MTIEIGFWNCNLAAEPYWEERTFSMKLLDLGAAVRRFALRCNTNPFSIFTAPEYALASKDKQRALPAEPVPVLQVSRYLTAMEKLSAAYPRILIAPGSIVIDTNKQVQNRVIGYFAGESVLFVGKEHGVGEVGTPAVGGYTFRPGNGGQVVTVQGLRIFTQICRDATLTSTPDPDADIHLTVGQGVGVEAIVKKKPNLALIVADAVNYAVVGKNGPLDPYAIDTAAGIKTYCYTLG